ncbi:MAG: hypothetical protein WEE89_22890 [Gemmatimonadota bacterium]
MSADAQEQLLDALQKGSLQHDALSPQDLALLQYAEALTINPASITDNDIAALRNAGLDDRAIHDACAIVSYYAFVNRIADGLGVELESGSTEHTNPSL